MARSSGLYFRVSVPKRLRWLLGCREVVRKLRAVDRAHARYLSNVLAYRLLRLFASGATTMNAFKFKVIVDRWLREALEEDAALRGSSRPTKADVGAAFA